MLSLDMVDLTANVEEDTHDIWEELTESSEETDYVGIKLATQVSPTSDDSKSTTPSVPLIIQIQSVDKDNSPSDDDLNKQVAMDIAEGSFECMTTALNNHFNKEEEDLSAEMFDIVAHRHISGILELQIEYTTGDCSWYPLEMVNDEDPQPVVNYVIDSGLGKVSNGQHCLWDHLCLHLLKRTLRRIWSLYLIYFYYDNVCHWLCVYK